jgi:hypothetical protein
MAEGRQAADCVESKRQGKRQGKRQSKQQNDR